MAHDHGVVQTPPAPAQPAASGAQVTMLDDRFNSSRITVTAGTTVTWVNNGNNLHDTSSLDGLWTSGSFPRGQTFSYTFDKPGTYQYLCRQHLLNGMVGTIVVQ